MRVAALSLAATEATASASAASRWFCTTSMIARNARASAAWGSAASTLSMAARAASTWPTLSNRLAFSNSRSAHALGGRHVARGLRARPAHRRRRALPGRVGIAGRRGGVRAAEAGEHRRVVERPLHRVVLPDHGIELRRLTGGGGGGLAVGQDNFTRVVVSADLAFENLHRRAAIGHAHREFGALDHAVHVRRVDGHGAWRATEGLEGAHHQIEQAALLGAGADINQAHGGVLVETQHRIVDEMQRGATVGADAHRIALAQHGGQRGLSPVAVVGVRDFDRAFQRGEAASAGRALIGRGAARDPRAAHDGEQHQCSRCVVHGTLFGIVGPAWHGGRCVHSGSRTRCEAWRRV